MMQGQIARQGHVGIAVSGGGDSMALLHLAHEVAQRQGGALSAVTVDHALRPDSASEAAQVAAFCAQRGIPHDTLVWHHTPGATPDGAAGNLQAAARQARYRLMADWARKAGVDLVLLGHTQDDQAETFLMRLAREAGLEGLSAMPAQFSRHGIIWGRPLLAVPRAALRAVLLAAGVAWVDDPSNDNLRFDRIKARKALDALAPLGITAQGLARISAQLDSARHALQQVQDDVSRRLIRQDQGDLVLDWDALASHPPEIRRRCLVAAIMWVSAAPYAPRRDDVQHLLAALDRAGQRTLSGCVLRRHAAHLSICRELQAVRDIAVPSTAVWDRRWLLDGPHAPHLQIRALGQAGLALCPDWRATGRSRLSLLASPAIWAGTTLIAAPLAAYGQGWSARIVADFHDGAVSH